jgi:hypothetical protein
MIGWGKTGRSSINTKLKVGIVNIITHDDCLERIRAFDIDDENLNMRQVICTAADPYVIMAEVSIYSFI